ncbi:sugar phosphate nucleotidyltransferase [Kitasatospora sp. NPDC051705]|uniref:sugar phosphate nucleotidyltransferase n=1 Tax=Kitasatospora sp. NPDC051705 TaxID=3364057 RepID=UPI0037B1E096
MTERSTTHTTSAAHYYTSTLLTLPERTVALVLVGGRGTRLRAAADPELQSTPKVLVPITTDTGPTPMLGHALTQLTAVGVRRIAVLTSTDPATGAQDVEAYALTHRARQVELTVHREYHPLGTAGAANAALALLPTPRSPSSCPPTPWSRSRCCPPPSPSTAPARPPSPGPWTVTTVPGLGAQNTGRIFLESHREHVVHALEAIDAILPAGTRQGWRQATSAGAVIFTPAPFRALFEEYAQRRARPGEADLYRQFMPWAISQGHLVGAYDIRAPAPDRLAEHGRTTVA